jgi:hypothetical protein
MSGQLYKIFTMRGQLSVGTAAYQGKGEAAAGSMAAGSSALVQGFIVVF